MTFPISNRYIVITPAKNEETKIGKSIESVISQTIPPVYYLIVNDGSTDNTQTVINHYSLSCPYLSSIVLPNSEWDIGLHYSHVCIEGFQHSIDVCNNKEINYEFILLLDADTILESEYVEKILSHFSENSRYGIISGGIYHQEDHQLILSVTSLDMPRGSGRIWRKECFIESGGYMLEVSPDTISNLKARNRGWITKQIPEIRAIEQRQTSTGNGIWNGAVKNGYFAYRLQVPFPSVFATFISHIFINKSSKIGVGYLYGYLSSHLRNKPRTSDLEIINHYSKYNIRYYIHKLFKIISRKGKYYDE